MNKKDTDPVKGKITSIFSGKVKDILLLGALGFLLFYTAYKIFQEEPAQSALVLSDNEMKITRLLKEIDGVGEASVVVCEEDSEVKSVVIVCEGANDLRVVMNIREAVAAALDTPQKSVKIYLKKD